VFLSYSVDDVKLVYQIAEAIKPYAAVRFWHKDNDPGTDVWQTIHKWIDEADCVIAVITDNVVRRGESVNQEVEYAKAHGKTVIPIVATGVGKDRLGCLSGTTYIPADVENLDAALDAVKRKVHALRKKKSDQEGLLLLIAFGVVLLGLGGKS